MLERGPFGSRTTGPSPSGTEEVAVAVIEAVADIDSDFVEASYEFLAGEAVVRASEEHPGKPTVLGHIVVLEEELPTRPEYPGDLAQRRVPVRAWCTAAKSTTTSKLASSPTPW